MNLHRYDAHRKRQFLREQDSPEADRDTERDGISQNWLS